MRMIMKKINVTKMSGVFERTNVLIRFYDSNEKELWKFILNNCGQFIDLKFIDPMYTGDFEDVSSEELQFLTELTELFNPVEAVDKYDFETMLYLVDSLETQRILDDRKEFKLAIESMLVALIQAKLALIKTKVK